MDAWSGAPRAGIKEVADHAGVSVGTVSNVLNRPERVSSSTRERVEASMHTLKFVRNASAKSLREGQSRVVGVVVLDLANPFYTEMVRGIEDRIEAEGLNLMLCSSDERPEREQRMFANFAEQGVRGVLVTPFEGTQQRASRLAELGTPVVLMDDNSSSHTFASAGVNDFEGGRQAVTHLLEQGHRRIGVVNGAGDLPQCRNRALGARRAITDAGLDPDRVLIVHNGDGLRAEAGQRGAEVLLGLDDPPTAIFCENDLVALGAMREIRRRNLGIPGDVAVIGYDDVHFAAELLTPLSSVHQPAHQLGYAAADLLLSGAKEHVVFTPTLITRGSSLRA